MKLLILTQKVDKNDPILGFFHRWIEEFAKRCELVTVICLEKGKYDLHSNVKVLSLGKPYFAKASQGAGRRLVSRIFYVLNFYRYIWQERKNYDAVFVHMNQEYVLLGWKLWKILGKKIYLWRNHAKGNILTNLAVLLSDKVFCTSPQSYTAKFKKTQIMPIGVDTNFFKPDTSITRDKDSVLLLGRVSPVKKVLEVIDWVKAKNLKATIAGPILAEDREYGALILKSLTPNIEYIGPVTQEEARKLYQSHEIYANFTPAGSMDKTIVEAAACGMKLEIRNPDLKDFKVEDHSLKLLVERLKSVMVL